MEVVGDVLASHRVFVIDCSCFPQLAFFFFQTFHIVVLAGHAQYLVNSEKALIDFLSFLSLLFSQRQLSSRNVGLSF